MSTKKNSMQQSAITTPDIIETVRSNRLDVEVPSDYFENIKEVHVIDEWTGETKVFKDVESQYP